MEERPSSASPGAQNVIADDVLLLVMSFLTPQDWSRSCSLVNKQWKKVSESDSLWKPACEKLWTGKAGVTIGVPFHNARYDPEVEFSVKELKYLLGRRYIKTGHLLEKSEFKRVLEESDMLQTIQCPRLKGKWKASYVFSLLDSKRQIPTNEELSKMEFTFFFNSNPLEFCTKARFEIDNSAPMPQRFVMDNWPMSNPRDLPWTRHSNGDVSVLNYPAHTFSRRSDDWSFVTQNAHVIFFQSNFDGFNQDKVVAELLERLNNPAG